MLRTEDLQRLLRQQPFQPFRLTLSNGKTFEVRHPELAVVGRTTLFIGVPAPDLPAPAFDDFNLVSLLHINDVQPIPPANPPSGNGPGA